MDLIEVCQEAIRSAAPGSDAGERNYIGLESKVRSALAGFDGVKTELRMPSTDLALAMDRIQISTLFADFTSVYIYMPGFQRIDILAAPTPDQIVLPTESSEILERYETVSGKPKVEIGFESFPLSWNAVTEFVENSRPLAESGRIMFRRKLMAGVYLKDQPMPRWVDVEPHSPGGSLIVQGLMTQADPIPIKSDDADPIDERLLGEITLPYLRNVSNQDYARILHDEKDLLCKFRSDVRAVLAAARVDPSRSSEIINDTVRPSVDRIERQFRSLLKMHSLRAAGATVSTIALSLLALTDMGIVSSISKVLGAGGFGLITREYADYLKSRAELREMNFYPLWRLGRTARS